jgi:flagellar basal body-associated protein FliL
MADEETKGESTESSSKGGGLKTIIIVAVLMLAEAGGLFVLINMMNGPKAADASQLVGLEGTGEEAPVEIELVKGQYQNMSTGRVWEWRAEIFLRVRQKNVAEIESIMERDKALIQEGISKIFGRAQDRHLREPGRETMTRQLTTYLNEIFGVDADEFPLVDRVLVPELKGFPADG